MKLFAAFTFAVALALPTIAIADSPLTSTPFAGHYQDVTIVASAGTTGMTDDVMRALIDPETAPDIRAALVNALGWQHPTPLAPVLAEYIATDLGVAVGELGLDDLDAGSAFSLGYLAAMDDYLDLSPIDIVGPLSGATPSDLLEHAMSQAPDSGTVRLIAALVVAQAAMSGSWCQVYTTVLNANGDDVELRAVAVATITDYTALYRSSCQQELQLQGEGHHGSVLGGH